MACHIIFYADKLPFLLHLLLSENIFLAVLVGVGGRCSMGVAGQRSRREIWQWLKNYTNIFREILLYFLKHLFGFIEICLYAKSSIIYLLEAYLLLANMWLAQPHRSFISQCTPPLTRCLQKAAGKRQEKARGDSQRSNRRISGRPGRLLCSWCLIIMFDGIRQC